MSSRLSITAKPSTSRQLHVTSQLEQIKLAQRSELAELWTKHFGQPPPNGLSTPLMRRSIAYRVQEKAYGGLRLTERTALRRSAGLDNGTAGSLEEKGNDPSTAPVSDKVRTADVHGAIAPNITQSKPRAPIQPSLRAGTRLVRNWQGKSHVVEVREDGFAWKGQSYDSLSAVALAITGAKWSGPRFFRL